MDVPAVRRGVTVALTGLALATAGCASPPENDPAAMAAYKQANDPIEPFNRNMLKANLVLDDAVLKPVAYIYKETLPEFSQDAVDSFLHNLRTPVILANDLMQGDGDRAWNTFVRFAANSTFGLGGLIDVAADMGYPSHDEDFGQTLAVWGIEPGPYLMLPLFGPSNPRDAIGRLFDTVIDPISWLAPTSWQYGQFATEAVNERAMNYDAIEDLKKTSLDFYAAVRSLYRQRRADEIRNGAPTANSSGSPSPMSGEPDEPMDEQKAEKHPPATSMIESPALDDMAPKAEAATVPVEAATPAVSVATRPTVMTDPVPMPPRVAVTPASMPAEGIALQPVPMPELKAPEPDARGGIVSRSRASRAGRRQGRVRGGDEGRVPARAGRPVRAGRARGEGAGRGPGPRPPPHPRKRRRLRRPHRPRRPRISTPRRANSPPPSTDPEPISRRGTGRSARIGPHRLCYAAPAT